MKTMNRRHVRVNNIILGPLERPALEWLAAHMPSRVTPDICTATGLFGALTTAVSYGLSNLHPGFLWLASLGFFINWFGDSLDGTLARYRHIERPLYGYFVDHTTDILCQVMIFVGMGLSPYVTFNIACLALVAYLMLSAMVFLRTYAVGEFKISYGGLGPTESRAVAVLLNTAMYFFGVQKIQIAQVMFSMYDIAIGAIGVLLFWFFIDTSMRDVRRLAALGK